MDRDKIMADAVADLLAHPEVGKPQDCLLDTATFRYEQRVDGNSMRITFSPKPDVGTWHFIRVRVKLPDQAFDWHLERNGTTSVPMRGQHFEIRYDRSVRVYPPRYIGPRPGYPSPLEMGGYWARRFATTE